jgi:hypothetical protein
MFHAVACVMSTTTVLTKYTIAAGTNAAVCNDGSPYAYYFKPGTSSNKWVFFQQGGSYCWDKATCDYRQSHDSTQMSSNGLPGRLTISYGIISDDPSDNPYFATWNMVQLPYCTSDAFSGTVTQAAWQSSLSFLGSRVIPSVVADLKADHGLVDSASTTLIYSGASAGGVGMWPNMDVLSSTLLPASHVVAVVDSGWFLDSVPLIQEPCTDYGLNCSVKTNLVNGLAAWIPAVDTGCAQAKAASDRWQCLMGKYVEPYISTPLFVFEWAYDLAQLYHDGIEDDPSLSSSTLAYAQESRSNLTATFFGAQRQHKYFFSPSCYQHVVINNQHSDWVSVTANGTKLPDALNDFVSGTSSGFILTDACNSPGCNPTCPPPQHIG